ncbi:unnamed protein product [Amoebophrya sp. A25]|nr:unnamed protein product [Amoebophrya sp. A25]|eukprot:GSA25T00020034001.1
MPDRVSSQDLNIMNAGGIPPRSPSALQKTSSLRSNRSPMNREDGRGARGGGRTVPSGPLTESLLSKDRLQQARRAFEANDPSFSANVHADFAAKIASGQFDFSHPERTLDEGEYVRPAVFGGLDGISTTFALLAGGVGVQLNITHLAALCLAQVFAGAFSMAFGEYVSSKAERQIAMRELNREKWEVENYPEGEIAEMIQIYMQQGLSVEDAQSVAFTLSKYPKFWVEHMLLHEIGILPPSDSDDCWKSSSAMFCSFVACGLVPILTYILVFLIGGGDIVVQYGFYVAIVASLGTLFLLGFAKNKIAESDPMMGGFSMVFQGCVAGAISYIIGVQIGGGTG